MKTRMWESRGFTLMELMLSLSLGAMLASWVVPGMSDLMQGMRVTAAGNHFMGMLEGTRYQSLATPGTALTICGSADGERCDKDQGRRIVVFQDSNANGVVNASERVLVHEEFLAGDDFWLVWRAFRHTDYLRWAGGRTDSMNGTFTLCNRRHKDKWLRQIVVNRVGRARLVIPAEAGGSALVTARQRCGW